MTIKIYKLCPLCKAKPIEGSGGWATDYTCGTRRGNLSGTIVWKGPNCKKARRKRTHTTKD